MEPLQYNADKQKIALWSSSQFGQGAGAQDVREDTKVAGFVYMQEKVKIFSYVFNYILDIYGEQLKLHLEKYHKINSY